MQPIKCEKSILTIVSNNIANFSLAILIAHHELLTGQLPSQPMENLLTTQYYIGP